jgi:hypothetical protein
MNRPWSEEVMRQRDAQIGDARDGQPADRSRFGRIAMPDAGLQEAVEFFPHRGDDE